MKHLLLESCHKTCGAHFSDEDPWRLPEHYGDAHREYRALREDAGLSDLSHQGCLLITGADRLSFLQSLISNDLNGLKTGEGCYALLLSPKGKILSDFHLFVLPEALLMTLPASSAEKTQKHLLRFRLRAKVVFSFPPWGHLLLSGPEAPARLARLLGENLKPMPTPSLIQKSFMGLSLLCIKADMMGEGLHLYFPEEGMDALWQALLGLDIRPVGQAALEIRRIEAGRPLYGIDMGEEILPVEAGIQKEAISYTKGCYPGQEVMARIRTYGHVNKQLSGLILEGDVLPKQGDKVFAGDKAVGWVTSAAASPLLGKNIAMAYLRTQAARPGEALVLQSAGGRIEAQAAALPFSPSSY